MAVVVFGADGAPYEASKLLCPNMDLLLFVFEADDGPAPNTNGAGDGFVVEEGFAVDRPVEVIEEAGIDIAVVEVAGAENNDADGLEPKTEDADEAVVAADAAPNNGVLAGLPNTKPAVELLTVAVALAVVAEAPNKGFAVLFEVSPPVELDAAAGVEPNSETPVDEPLIDAASFPNAKPEVVKGVGALGENVAEAAAGLSKTNPPLGVDVLTVDEAMLELPNITFGGVLLASGVALNVIGLIAAA